MPGRIRRTPYKPGLVEPPPHDPRGVVDEVGPPGRPRHRFATPGPARGGSQDELVVQSGVDECALGELAGHRLEHVGMEPFWGLLSGDAEDGILSPPRPRREGRPGPGSLQLSCRPDAPDWIRSASIPARPFWGLLSGDAEDGRPGLSICHRSGEWLTTTTRCREGPYLTTKTVSEENPNMIPVQTYQIGWCDDIHVYLFVNH